MDAAKTYEFVKKEFDTSILPTLCEYIKIPNVSPLFDPEWKTNGLLNKAAELLVDWVKKQNVPNLEIEIVRLEGRTPLIFITVPSSNSNCNETVLMYGHLDKQPPLSDSWETGLGPYTPVIKDGKLYGRGGADDGYSIFAAITSIRAIKDQGLNHGRIVITIEACEESGSPDLPAYVEHLTPRIGTPNLIVCLDSGCGTYDQLWLTTSLRVNLKVSILKQGSHSGHASGIVPDTFRIARSLISRIEDEKTGKVLIPELFCEIPEQRLAQAKSCADTLGSHIHEEFTFVEGAKPMHSDITELILNRTWRPTVTITGVDGIPSLTSAGNVLRTHTTLKLSIRVPPRLSAPEAAKAVKAVLEKDPPYGAHVTCEIEKSGTGWDSPQLADWLAKSLSKASNNYYKKDANFLGEGGSIPFMFMLGQKFPKTQFVITGVLGPDSNAHGPNEMLHIDMAQKITCCVASIVVDHYNEFAKH